MSITIMGVISRYHIKIWNISRLCQLSHLSKSVIVWKIDQKKKWKVQWMMRTCNTKPETRKMKNEKIFMYLRKTHGMIIIDGFVFNGIMSDDAVRCLTIRRVKWWFAESLDQADTSGAQLFLTAPPKCQILSDIMNNERVITIFQFFTSERLWRHFHKRIYTGLYFGFPLWTL